MTRYFRCDECCNGYGQDRYGAYIDEPAPCYIRVVYTDGAPDSCPCRKVGYDDASDWVEISEREFYTGTSEAEVGQELASYCPRCGEPMRPMPKALTPMKLWVCDVCKHVVCR